MRNVALRRTIAMVLALVMMLAMAACAPKDQGNEVDIAYDGDTVLAPDTDFKIVIGSHSSWPYNENHKIWQYFKEEVGGNIQIDAIPNSEFGTKINLMMASPDTLPDLLHVLEPAHVNNHADSGAYIAIDEHLDKLPNYTAFLQSLDSKTREQLVMLRTFADGHNYWPIVYGSETVMNFATWMYREDIFEKHGLEIPETVDDLYQVCKKLKELYPESYPLCLRAGLRKISTMGPSWDNDFNVYLYYDFDSEEWKYGAFTDTMKEIVIYFKKMMEEGLIPPDFMSIATSSWEELMSTDRGFITAEPIVRINFFNIPNQKRNPDYKWAAFLPPAHDAKAPHKIAKSNDDPTGYVLPNTKDDARIDNALKVLDWMYTDEAIDLLSWGKEGETYQVDKNGKKTFILEGDITAQVAYGASTYGLYQVIRKEAFEQVVAAGSEVDPIWMTWIEEDAQPGGYLSFNKEEQEVINHKETAIISYLEENLIHFIDGTKPLDEWDAYIEGAYKLGLKEVLKAYEAAYNRVRGR